jgi:hypothetical protein
MLSFGPEQWIILAAIAVNVVVFAAFSSLVSLGNHADQSLASRDPAAGNEHFPSHGLVFRCVGLPCLPGIGSGNPAWHSGDRSHAETNYDSECLAQGVGTKTTAEIESVGTGDLDWRS